MAAAVGARLAARLCAATGMIPKDVATGLASRLSDRRIAKITEVAAARRTDLVLVLEGLYDQGNVSAAVRSAEALGFGRVCLINPHGDRFKKKRSVSVGSEKWVQLDKFTNTEDCFEELRSQGFLVALAHAPAAPGPGNRDSESSRDSDPAASVPAVGLGDLDPTLPTAFVLGNEYAGVSRAALQHADCTFRIDTGGFTQSLNVSVAAGIVAYEAVRARAAAEVRSTDHTADLEAEYCIRCLMAKGLSLEQVGDFLMATKST